MIHTDEIRVYYADTDAYGVVWHGAYLRWLEAGRIEYSNKVLKLDLKQMQEDGCLLPVVELNIKYKISDGKIPTDIFVTYSLEIYIPEIE